MMKSMLEFAEIADFLVLDFQEFHCILLSFHNFVITQLV